MKTTLLFTASLFGISCGLHAQTPNRQCFAANNWSQGPGALWPGLLPRFLEVPDSVSPATMRSRLVGAYTLLEVVTQGEGLGKEVIESRMRIWPEPVYDTTRSIGDASRIIGYAETVALRSGFLHDTVKAVARAHKRFFRVQYSPPNTLRFVGVSDSSVIRKQALDGPGPWLEVLRIDDGVLQGRWLNAGIEVRVFSTSVGQLAEQGFGYFCAWPGSR